MTLFKELIYIFYANLININLYLLNKISRNKYIYCDIISFGDCFTFYIENYYKIIKNKNKVLVLSKLEKDIAEIFFCKRNIVSIFFLIPRFIPVYRISHLLKNKSYFKPDNSFTIDSSKVRVSNKHRRLLIKLLRKKINLISPKLKRIKNEKFILFFIKHYYKKNIITNGSDARQTYNFQKVYKTINFLINNKNKIIILGDKFDKSIPVLKKKYFNNKYIRFFLNMSPNQSMLDQLYIHYYSLLSIGSDSGAFVMSKYLKKKIIFFDTMISYDQSYQKFRNIKMLYKKVSYERNFQNFSVSHLKDAYNINKKSLLKETSFLEIKNEIKKKHYKLSFL
jgi:hypothetical protein